MINYHKKVAAIVPAFNEEANISNVLKILLASKYLNDVILVDDGSTDKTAEIGKSLGVKVLKILGNKGKGNAMKQGLRATKAGIIAFFDADLIGLTENHIFSLIEPVLKDEADMCVGIRGRLMDLPELIAKIDPLLAIGGERCIRRNLLEDIPEKFIQNFAVETSLNYYCIKNGLKIKYVNLPNLSIISKEKKWGFRKGFIIRIKMIWQIIKIRIKKFK
jgi:glycosyltransferase involved in cell wall biosynthesis